MSRILRITEPAQQDLDEIWSALEPYGVDIADQCLNAIQRKFLQLQQFPGLGRSREDLAPGLRSVIVRDVVVLYRSIEGLVIISRVIHGRRDLRGIVGKMSPEN
jgi:toxin ParE1/3/4